MPVEDLINYPRIASHSVYLFYPFYFPSASLKEVSAALVQGIDSLVISDILESLSFPDKLGSSDFRVEEFKDSYTIKALFGKLREDGIDPAGDTIEALNKLLKQPDLYSKIQEKRPLAILSESLKVFKDSYEKDGKEDNLKRLNRVVFEEFYPQETPKSHKLKERVSSVKENMSKKVWQSADFPISKDLHDYARGILNGERNFESRDDAFYGHKPFTITAETKNILSGEWGRKGKGLELNITKTAAERTGVEDRWLPFRIEDITCFIFGTGVGIVLLEIKYDVSKYGQEVIQHNIILEGNYACGHNSAALRWKDFGSSDAKADKQSGLSLETIVKTLLRNCPVIVYPEWLRIFSYTIINYSEILPTEHNKAEVAFRMGRKHTPHYSPNADLINSGLLIQFQNIMHSMSLEGGAVIVEQNKDSEGKEIEFLKTFPATARKRYLPITILAYQEYLILKKMIQESLSPVNFNSPTRKDLKSLEDKRDELLDFRLNYRFSHVSSISMHNDAYALWRRILYLDKMLEEVTQDVNEVVAYLTYKINEKHSQKKDKIDRLHTALGIAIGALLVISGIFGMNLKELKEVELIGIESPIFVIITIVIFSAAFLGALGYWYSTRKDTA